MSIPMNACNFIVIMVYLSILFIYEIQSVGKVLASVNILLMFLSSSLRVDLPFTAILSVSIITLS